MLENKESRGANRIDRKRFDERKRAQVSRKDPWHREMAALSGTGSQQPIQKQSERAQDRRGDARTEREAARDRGRRIPEGGDPDRGGSDFQSDWAGRAILFRYLTGGGDWTITNDSDWSKYMKANGLLQDLLKQRLQLLFERHLGRRVNLYVNDQFHAEIENGEGIVGYQYLHGTNAAVGDFQIRGLAFSTNEGMAANLRFIWNDIIDPNPGYDTDIEKNNFAEKITLGRATPYTIKIIWDSQIRLGLDATGKILRISGYPFSE